jgi:hypothetical protein
MLDGDRLAELRELDRADRGGARDRRLARRRCYQRDRRDGEREREPP